MTDIKYTPEDIDRIFNERVDYLWADASLKKGIVIEWIFEYPNGNKIAFVEASFPVDEVYFDWEIGVDVCIKKIKSKLWEICGQYSIITGEKL